MHKVFVYIVHHVEYANNIKHKRTKRTLPLVHTNVEARGDMIDTRIYWFVLWSTIGRSSGKPNEWPYLYWLSYTCELARDYYPCPLPRVCICVSSKVIWFLFRNFVADDRSHRRDDDDCIYPITICAELYNETMKNSRITRIEWIFIQIILCDDTSLMKNGWTAVAEQKQKIKQKRVICNFQGSPGKLYAPKLCWTGGEEWVCEFVSEETERMLTSIESIWCFDFQIKYTRWLLFAAAREYYAKINKESKIINMHTYSNSFIHFIPHTFIYIRWIVRWLLPRCLHWIHWYTNEFSVVLHFFVFFFISSFFSVRCRNTQRTVGRVSEPMHFPFIFFFFHFILSFPLASLSLSLLLSLCAFLICDSVHCFIVLGCTLSVMCGSRFIFERDGVCECLFIRVCFSMFICAPSRQNFNGHFSLLHRESRTINNEQL